MNHNKTIEKLTQVRDNKLKECKQLQKEIGDLSAEISKHERLYKLQNKYADECNEILSGYSRDNIREVLKFLILSLAKADGYWKYYKNVDIPTLLDNNDFFDFLIVQIGKATISDIKKKFDRVEDTEDGLMIKRADKSTASTENTRNRLWKKLTKKSVIIEAERVTNDQKKAFL